MPAGSGIVLTRARAVLVGLGQIGCGYDADLSFEKDHPRSSPKTLTHARALACHPGFALEAGVDPSPEARQRFSRIYGAPAYVDLSSWRAACADAPPDLVVIAVAPQLQLSLVQELLQLTTPSLLLLEKPLACDIEQARTLQTICERHPQMHVAVNYIRRWLPSVQAWRWRLQRGEGGLLVTNDDHLAERLRLIRNHGEAVIQSDDPSELANILGHNFRLGEIEAAIARAQLHKLPELVASRQRAANRLRSGLIDLPGLQLPVVADQATHVYYVFGMILDPERLGKPRSWIFDALKAEGITALASGYQCIHLNPLFRHRIAYGTECFPWKGLASGNSFVTYGPGLCPVAENLHQRTFLGLNLCAHTYTDPEIDLVVAAFRKVWAHLEAGT